MKNPLLRTWLQARCWLMLASFAVFLLGCSALLPHGERKVVSRWQDFDTAMEMYERVVPYQTSEWELDALGFSPRIQPNVQILNGAEIAERFQRAAFDGGELPRGLQDCFRDYSACYGYHVKQRSTRDKRYGNFLADFMNFKRKTETRGWEFTALIVLIDGQVVYKQWSGTPEIHEYRDETNPLGPLQGVGPSLIPSAR